MEIENQKQLIFEIPIKKAILNRKAYIKILKAPVVDAGEVADASEDVADEIENEEATSTPENLDDSE